MAKSNADIQRDKRAKERALLDRIGAEKRSLIVSKALADALQVLGDRHDFEEWQETVSTFLINLAAAPAEESARFASMSRHEITISENMSRLFHHKSLLMIQQDPGDQVINPVATYSSQAPS